MTFPTASAKSPSGGIRYVFSREVFRRNCAIAGIVGCAATVTVATKEVVVHFHRRAHLPILLASGLFDQEVKVPWWRGYTLQFKG